jgi:hypothetical protein
MKPAATFSNHAEAGFFQSLLETENIVSFLGSGDMVPAGVHSISVLVAEADYDRAREIAAAMETKREATPPLDPHPASGFPFLGIMGFVALLWSLAMFLLALLEPRPEQNLTRHIVEALGVACISIVSGLFFGAFIALFCLICRPIYKKLKS